MAQTLLSDAIDDYERFRRSMSIAKSTLKQEKSTMKRFLAVSGNIYVHNITDLHITRFFEDLARTKEPTSMRNDHTFLLGFFEWCRKTKRMNRDSDPMYGRRAPVKVVKERSRIHVSKFPALLDAAEKRSPRDRVMMALLLYTLGRDQEICTLRIKDIDLDAGYLRVIVHKSKKEDRIPISSELDVELRRWLTVYAQEVGHLEPHYYVVPSRQTLLERQDNGRIGAKHARYTPERKLPYLSRYVTPILADIGFPTVDENGKTLGEGAHTIRRSGARALYDRLVDDGYDRALRLVQAMLHHSSVSVTEQYIGVTADRRTRDDILRGKPMYDLHDDNVVQLAR